MILTLPMATAKIAPPMQAKIGTHPRLPRREERRPTTRFGRYGVEFRARFRTKCPPISTPIFSSPSFRTMKNFPLTRRGALAAASPPPCRGAPIDFAAVGGTRSPSCPSDHSGNRCTTGSGYYDKFAIFESEQRSSWRGKSVRKPPHADTRRRVRIGMVDTQEKTIAGPAGQDQTRGDGSRAACCSWRPGERIPEIVLERIARRCPVCRVMDVKTRRTANAAPPDLRVESRRENSRSPADFSRIQRMRPGLGLRRFVHPCAEQGAPRIPACGKCDMIPRVSVDLFKLPPDGRTHSLPWKTRADPMHYFNHSADQPRRVSLHRSCTRCGTEHRVKATLLNHQALSPLACSPSRWTDRTVRARPVRQKHRTFILARPKNTFVPGTRPEVKRDAFYSVRDANRFASSRRGNALMTVNGHNTYCAKHRQRVDPETTPTRQGERQEQSRICITSRATESGVGRFPFTAVGTPANGACDTHREPATDGESWSSIRRIPADGNAHLD